MKQRINFNKALLLVILFLLLIAGNGDWKKKDITIANSELYLPLYRLSDFASSLNIEGLHRAHNAKLQNNELITAIFNIVLDTPGKILHNYEEGLEIDKLHFNPKGNRMENEIPGFHEEKFNLFWLIVLNGYIENAHTFSKKPKHEIVNITIHLHRGKSAAQHLDVLKKIFTKFFSVPETSFQDISTDIPAIKFKLPYKNIEVIIEGDKRKFHRIYSSFERKTDILIEFGFVGALNPSLKSGDVVIPNSSIDFDFENLTLNLNHIINTDNHLMKYLPEFLEKYQEQHIINFCNLNLYSDFKEMKSASRYTLKDIHFSTILSVENFFVPSKFKNVCGNNFEKPCLKVVDIRKPKI